MSTGISTFALITDFTAEPLADYLRSPAEAPTLAVRTAPFDQVTQVLLDSTVAVWNPRPDAVLIWTRPERQLASFAQATAFQRPAPQALWQEVEAFAAHVRRAADRARYTFVATWTMPPHQRGWGMLNMRPGLGLAHHLMQLNLRLAEALADLPNVYVLDAARWTGLAGRRAHDPKLWLMSKMAFGLEVLQEAAADLKAALRGLAGQAKKLIVLDLDDTLWGGIVGEGGTAGITLGGHSPTGEAFVEFQRALKALTQRGILLAIVSKNDEAVALEAIDQHPAMVLRRADFAGWRVNWQDKAQNIVELVEALNLGLEAVVFIDDNPAERARVRAALPQVTVPEWPADKLHYARALLEARDFDTPALTAEDARRTKMYQSEQQRQALRQQVASLDDWLASLELVIQVEALNEVNLVRATQLLNKTNQLNLATRRLGEAEFWDWAHSPGQAVWTFDVSDRFGRYGLTGLASLTTAGGAASLTDFVLSCRVMGRGVEQAILHVITEQASARGCADLTAFFQPTERNHPCRELLDSASGFEHMPGTDLYRWAWPGGYPLPAHIRLQWSASAPAVAASPP